MGLLEHYVLDERGEPIAVDLLTWALWYESRREDRVVLQDRPARDVFVSTVFLGLDHGFWFDGQPHDPVLWETMIFGGVFDQFQNRYSSRLDALRGHAFALAVIETYRAVPRKTKRALQKWASHAYPSPTPGRSERRRLQRILTRLGWAEVEQR